jgi:tRNA-guanine family transglycosylase
LRNFGENLKFFPVVNLLTGPPGLIRNGGIWKFIKRDMAKTVSQTNVMVQALHFTTYNLSQRAWEDWDLHLKKSSRLLWELDKTFGDNRDIFLDSGGFQTLYSDKLDLSKWYMNVAREDIFTFQMKFKPSRVASFDFPIAFRANDEQSKINRKKSADNALWLLDNIDSYESKTIPYLVVHGRNPYELQKYLLMLEKRLEKRNLNGKIYGIALGSQVSLSSNPLMIIQNVKKVLKWMNINTSEETPFHIFGAGDKILGAISRLNVKERSISYDNSTYAQNAFRLGYYNIKSKSYQKWNPGFNNECTCFACETLKKYDIDEIWKIMTAPAYSDTRDSKGEINRSGVMSYIALHNLYWWKSRVEHFAKHYKIKPGLTYLNLNMIKNASNIKETASYYFPISQYKPKSRNLIILSCTRTKPYLNSPQQRRILNYLEKSKCVESKDFDRITISGMYGPVHWKDETHPAILGYDFVLTNATSKEHIDKLKFITGTILGVIRKKYENVVGYFPPPAYNRAFAPVIRSFKGEIAEDVSEIPEIIKE